MFNIGWCMYMEKRMIYLDILKIIAIIAVVINHSYLFLSSNDLFSYSFKTFLFLAVKFAVPLFLMVSGALLLNKKDTFKDIFGKRIFRVLIPLIVITLIWSLYYKSNLMRIPIYLIGFNEDKIPYWAWYIYVIIAIYLILPFLQKMVKNFEDKDYKMFGLLFLIIPSFISFGCIILQKFFSKILFVTSYITGVIFSKYIALVVIGYYLSKKEITKKIKNVAIFSLIISLLIALVLEILNYIIYDNTSFLLDDCLLPTSIIPAIYIFIIVKYYFDNGVKKEKVKNVIIYMSSLVFGIYLCHAFFINIFYNFEFVKAIFKFNNFIGFIVLDWFVFFISGFIIALLRKIPIINKFL